VGSSRDMHGLAFRKRWFSRRCRNYDKRFWDFLSFFFFTARKHV